MKVTAGTIARTIILGVALANQLLSATGHAALPIADEQVESIVSTGATIIVALAAWWKNNSFTEAAIVGDRVKEKVRYGEIGADEVMRKD